MGDSDFRVCPCVSSLWDRLTGRKKTEDRPAPGQVEMNPAPPSSGGTSRTGSFYVGLWDFAGGQEDEMSFQKGDRFKVLGRSEEWWTVQRVDKNGNVRGTGNVPFNYLEREESLETQPWFSGTTTRSKAETLLMSPENEHGAFLVRRSESETVGYVLSVKSWNPLRHFKVLQDEDGNYQFESSQHFPSLVDLVDHFADSGFEGIGKLGEPCKKKKPAVPDMTSGVSELDFTVPLEEESFFAALWDFDARQQEEVSFQRGDQFKVLGRSEEWWKVQKIDPNGQVLSTGIVPQNYLERAGSLETQPWYFGKLTRSETEAILKSSENDNGAFLIRRSDKDSVGYVFSVNTLVNHFKIQKNKDNNYHLEQTPNFSSLSALVQHYSRNRIASMGILGAPCKKIKTLSEWERPKEEFVLEEELSDGSFADVYRGTWRNNTNVAIKVIKKEYDIDLAVFRREIQQLVKLRHRHLVSLLAVCTETAAPYVVTELMEKGSLLHFLRGPEGQHQDTVSLVEMGAQVADGMSYLEENNCVHSELAARNVLVGEDYICKVADFGLGRLFKETFYNMDESKFPYRWSAPEVIASMRFSNKSDVWSFGVLLYEIVTFGGVPYPAFSTREVPGQVASGYRMSRPPKCPEFLHNIMKECWSEEPEDRPTFKSLRERLKNGKASQERADEDDK